MSHNSVASGEKDMKTKKENWLKILLSFASQCKGKMLLSVIFSIISVLSGLIPYLSVYEILRLFIENTATFQDVLHWCGIALLGYGLKTALFGVSTSLSHISAYAILETIRLRIADKLMKMPLGQAMSRPIGEIKEMVVDRVESIEPPLAHMIPEGIGHLALPLLTFILLLVFDWRMALASIVTIPIALICLLPMMKNFEKNYEIYVKSGNHVNSTIVEYIEGIQVIKAFGQTGRSYEKYTDAILSFKNHTLNWLKGTFIPMKFMCAVAPSTLLGTVPVGLWLYTTGALDPAGVAICVILSMSMVSSIGRLEVFMEEIREMNYTISKTDEFLNQPELPDAEESVNLNSCEVRLDRVSFSYNSETEVLHDISLSLPEGSFTALVGPSGSGKSTIARLISRFWDVSDGEITIGDTDIRDIPLSRLAKTMSFVAQDNFLFNCSLKENIRLGNPDASDEEVYAAAKAALCDDFINKLPQGYETPAGDAGKRLSGGEKQRIAIARIMLKNAPIVILDEATAFTDPENEDKLQQSIARLTRGKTLLVIAHRLSTIKSADRIVVLNNGRIEDAGSQNELLARCPLYENMWRSHIGAKDWAVSQKPQEDFHV